ncbi:uncharacterized protein EV420DRAFT_1651596 [Desarmillaria tabescens]|uniref:Uncharacterized protein n=1 Tax=Armillaria tabescens TaxID=1929756 RepID=A0AA39J9E8_ARMTA|nr:uncharacterized protein EV420DRAFT_1651596 [Desarmillaria tabescens]KAK0438149.1 hypothetical protein EV420DRAFT_1651596 [Desarmillaria tabescens]
MDIGEVEFCHIDDLCALLNYHPRLQTLKLSKNISIRDSEKQENMELKHNLYVSAVMANSQYRFPFDLCCLRNLILAVAPQNFRSCVAAIMTPVAKSIERLELNIFTLNLRRHYPTHQSNSSLPSLPRLRSIRIYYESPGRSLLDWLAFNIFRHAPKLQEIMLTTSLLSNRLTDGHVMIGEGVWMRLDTVIAAHPTIHSSMIDLSVFRSTRYLDWREMMMLSIQRLLPATVAKGITYGLDF